MLKKLPFILLFLASQIRAQHSFNSYLPDKAGYREHSLDITHMLLEVGFEPKEGKVLGKVTHTFKALRSKTDSVFFDAPGIKISSIQANGKNLDFSKVNEGIWVKDKSIFNYPNTGKIIITYEATPRKGIYFIGWNEPTHDEKSPWAVRNQIWTQGQGVDNRHWIPMYDDMNDKFITETIITFDSKYQVLSNGVLKKKSSKNNITTWHYAMSKPHAGYLLMLAIGNYGVQTAKSNTGVPLQYWYYPEFKERIEPTFLHTPQMFSFMKEQTGIDYPWETYSQVMVQDFLYGAMENTTATIFGDFFNVDARAFLDRNYIGVNMHEFTHQWFGDFITARDGRDTWLQESFATFYPKEFSKIIDGYDEWCWQRRQHQNAAIEAGKKDNFAVRHTSGGTSRVYPKGAAVISMLQYVLGDDQFKRVIYHYLKAHAYANVETNDLQQAVKDELGINLDWFFDEWIYRGGEPHYSVHYEDLTYQNGSRATEIAIEQIHATNETVRYFKMPITLEVHYSDGSFDTHTETLDEAFEVVKINNPLKKNIVFVLFDPNSNVLKQVTFKKSFNELQSQVSGAKYLLDRYDALVALRQESIDLKRSVIINAIGLNQNQHYAFINEAISQLAGDNNASTKEALAKLFSHNKASVGENLVSKLNPADEFWKSAFIRALTDSSYDVVKTSLTKLCEVYPESANEYLKLTSSVYGMNNSARIKWIQLNEVYLGSNQNLQIELMKYASPMYEFRTRINAFNALKELGLFNDNLASHLFQAMLSTNGRLAAPAADLLNYFLVQAKYKQLVQQKFKSTQWKPWQKELLLKQSPLLQ